MKIILYGEEIEMTPIQYNELKKENYTEMEYYHRKGNRYYFRNKMGIKIMICSYCDFYDDIKYGEVIDLSIK